MGEERFSGVVQWFNDAKGFGFIKPEDGGEDLFIHQSSIRSDGYRSLVEGDHVEFSIANGDKEKTKAIDVTGPNGTPLQSKKDNYGGRGGGGYRFRGGRRGGDRRNSGGGCYQCGDLGHLARDCVRCNNAGGGACFNCGEVGHLARDCRSGNKGGGGSGSCFSCGEYGHMARDCGKGSSVGSGGDCFRCGAVGHLARDCSKESERYGGRSGGGNVSKSTCFNCGKPGHLARECLEDCR